MRQFLLLLLLFIILEGSARTGDTLPVRQVKQPAYSTDTILRKLEKFKDSLFNTLPYTDSFHINENNTRNLMEFVDLQKKQKAREKRGALIRIGIGIAFLIVLIIGLRRKTRK